MQPDLRDRQAEDRAGMKVELGQVLGQERDEAGVVRTRRKLGKDHLVPGDEELDAEDPVAAEIVDDLPGHVLGIVEQLLGHRRRLPGFLVIAALLPVADGLAERYPLAGADRQQGDLVFEGDELLDDHLLAVAAHVRHRIVPGLLQLAGRAHGALPLARTRT